MKLAFAILAYFGLSNAVTISLWKPANRCSGVGIVCRDIAPNTCCRNGDRFGSGQAGDPSPNGAVTQLYSRRNGLDCGRTLGPVKPIPVCITSGVQGSVSGMAWRRNSAEKREASMDFAECETSVLGDPAYTDGVTVWVISTTKFNSLHLTVPENSTEVAAFFQTYADVTFAKEAGLETVSVN